MDTETNEQQYEEGERADAQKLQQAYLVSRYQPQQGRADKLASNIPGSRSIGSAKGTIR